MTQLIKRPGRQRAGLWDDDFNNLFEGFFRPTRWIEEAPSEDLVPAIDIVETDHEYKVHAELPGIKKDNIDVNVNDGVLTISAESRSDTEEKEKGHILRQERRYGKYVRSLRLGSQVDASKVKASYKDGVLELILPKLEQVKPKKISIDVG